MDSSQLFLKKQCCMVPAVPVVELTNQEQTAVDNTACHWGARYRPLWAALGKRGISATGTRSLGN